MFVIAEGYFRDGDMKAEMGTQAPIVLNTPQPD